MKKMFACIMIGALLASSALAEYRWEGEYPAAAANLPNAYTVAANPRVKALAEYALNQLLTDTYDTIARGVGINFSNWEM